MLRNDKKHRETHLVLRAVVHGVPEIFADGYVDFETAESPRDEDNVTVLRVERKEFNVESAVGLDQSRIHPQHVSI